MRTALAAILLVNSLGFGEGSTDVRGAVITPPEVAAGSQLAGPCAAGANLPGPLLKMARAAAGASRSGSESIAWRSKKDFTQFAEFVGAEGCVLGRRECSSFIEIKGLRAILPVAHALHRSCCAGAIWPAYAGLRSHRYGCNTDAVFP